DVNLTVLLAERDEHAPVEEVGIALFQQGAIHEIFGLEEEGKTGDGPDRRQDAMVGAGPRNVPARARAARGVVGSQLIRHSVRDGFVERDADIQVHAPKCRPCRYFRALRSVVVTKWKGLRPVSCWISLEMSRAAAEAVKGFTLVTVKKSFSLTWMMGVP